MFIHLQIVKRPAVSMHKIEIYAFHFDSVVMTLCIFDVFIMCIIDIIRQFTNECVWLFQTYMDSGVMVKSIFAKITDAKRFLCFFDDKKHSS